MRKLCERAAIGLAMVAAVMGPGGRAVAAEPAQVAQFVEGFVAEHMADARVPGMVFVMVDHEGIVVAEAFGAADLDDGRAMTVDTPLRVGSLSKPVTAAIALELAETATVDLDVPVDTYLDVDLTDGYGPASTIRQLLRHRGGYPDAIVESHHLEADEAIDLDAWTRRLPSRSLAPDMVASYSSVGYTLAGAALASAADTSFEELARQVLFDRLGMEHATFRQPAPVDVAVGYAWNGDDFEPYPVDVPDMVPGVGLVANGRDLARFMMALLDENGPLSTSTRNGLLAVVGPGAGLRGYTTGLTEWRYPNRTVLYHEGNGIGTANRMMILPDEGVGIFTAVNGEALTGLGDASIQTRFVRDLHEELVEEYYGDSSTTRSTVPPAGAGVPATDAAGIYVPTRVDPDSILRLEALVTQFEAAGTADGIRFGGTPYVADSEGVYGDGRAGIMFREGPDEVIYATGGGTGSYRQAAWWETSGINLAVVGGSLLLMVGGLVLGARRAPRTITWSMAATGVTVVTFFGVLAFALSTARVMEMFTGLPIPIRVAQAAAAGVLLSTVVLAATIAFRGRERSLPARALTGGIAVAVAGSAISVWAAAWSILPLP